MAGIERAERLIHFCYNAKVNKPIPSERKKTPDQVAAIKETQRAAEAAMSAVISYLRSVENPTSEKAHGIIDDILETHGCESPEGHIVAGGVQSAEPHEAGRGRLKRGEQIVVDIYPRSKRTGYFADMSRTVCRDASSSELQKMYNAVLAAQELAISMVRPNAKCREIQEAVEQLFADAGYETSGEGKEFPFAEGFVHSLGHGVGLNVHELPRIGRKSTDILEEGDVITIEPGLYYPSIGGIRLEDMLLVTRNGSENLTNFSKRFVI